MAADGVGGGVAALGLALQAQTEMTTPATSTADGQRIRVLLPASSQRSDLRSRHRYFIRFM
jgi:hypothetical protein